MTSYGMPTSVGGAVPFRYVVPLDADQQRIPGTSAREIAVTVTPEQTLSGTVDAWSEVQPLFVGLMDNPDGPVRIVLPVPITSPGDSIAIAPLAAM